MIGIPCCL